MNQNGNTLVIGVVIGAAVMAVVCGAYFLGTQSQTKNLQQSTQDTQNVVKTGQSTPLPVAGTAFQSRMVKGLTVRYSSPFKEVDEGAYLAEKYAEPDPDGGMSRSKNFIDFREHIGEMYVGYTTKQWFDKVNGLAPNSPVEDGRDKMTKLSSGKTQTGESFIIYKWEPSSSFQGMPALQVRANILKGDKLYDLILNDYDELGLKAFDELVASAEVN